jgi:long-subunit fatty acid transport protein
MLLKFRYLLLLTFISFTQFAWSQGQGNSPYNVIGIGEVTEESVAAQDMMGGAGTSFSNSFYINHINPAMLVKNRTIGLNKYVAFNIGLKGGYKVLSQGNKVQDDFGLNMSNLTMVFPVKPKWAMGISIRPYSVADNVTKIQKDFVGSNETNEMEYRNAGGISRVAFTNSFILLKGLYWGIEGQYNFGNIQRDTTSSITGSSEYFRNSGRYNLKGASLKTGLTYQLKLNKKWNLNMAGVYQFGSTLKGESLRIFSVLGEAGNGPVYIQSPDTLALANITSQIPSKYKVGLSLESSYHWLFAADYGYTKWSNLKQFDATANKTLVDAKELNFGMEWIPNASSSKYFNQVFYRLGFKHIDTPYQINNTKIKDQSFSLGLSLPMGFGNPSYIDIALSLGRRGVNANSLIQENYTKVSVNFSLLSSWFNKPRID